MPKVKKLTIKESKFITRKVAGDTNAKAYIEAGYKASTRRIADVNASKILSKDRIQQALEEALKSHEMTPEWAVGKLKDIAEQDKERGAQRLAIKDSLELMGWRRGEQAQVTVQVENAWFNQTRDGTT